MRRLFALSLFACIALASHAADAPSLRLIGIGKPAITLDVAALAAMPRTTVQAGAHGAASTAWDGVSMLELLHRADAPLDQALRGRALAAFVRVTASDGYQVVFSLSELDAAFGATKVILADHHEGKPLDAKDGPFRLIVPGDSRPARWEHGVISIEVVDGGTTTRAPAKPR
ncbi:molybdopterin-dependent oxidoreductase [Pinirhizobacter sp.]|uniref:molybdopterin-dependent oxidoreductase n=1 Tax=Pinirhizobacter sp. TaxID=2950432 RepID=UPI002F3F2B1A